MPAPATLHAPPRVRTEDGPDRPPPALAVRAVSFGYRTAPVLDEISFSVEKGRFTALLGPNGAGKTTLFSLIARLLLPRRGHIEICGRDLIEAGARALRAVGIVFQEPTLDVDLSVLQNLNYFARLRGLSGTEAGGRIDRELRRVGIAARGHDKVRALSGGQRRRVEIARALLHDPALLLFDEPTVGLDAASRDMIVAHVHALAAERGIGVLWATHLIDEVRPTDDLVVLDRGRVAASGLAGDVAAEAGGGSLAAAFRRLTGPPAAAPA